MRRSSFQVVALVSALATAGALFPARAQDPNAANADDMKRGVARISLMDGDVSVRRGDSGDWVAGVINAPLLAEDNISTGPNSRAEVQFDASNVIRLGGVSEIRLTTLEYGRYQMQLAHGTATYRVLRASNANIEVDTPNISVRPSKVGAYRISVGDNGQTELTVRLGDVEVFTPRGSQWVNAGQTMTARGSASDPEFQITGAIPGDDWDHWNETRDGAILQSASAQKVPQGVYGAEDLDHYGTWVDTPDYGNVWRPTEPADWAPYAAGRWVWEDWYGWTWVSADPWGWAPYHYGRWFYAGNNGWCWYPGVYGVPHYWSPALVGFFGFGGGGFGIGFGFGNIGWVALAPFEVFHPWWGRGYYGSAGYINRSFHVTNVNVTNVYRNARVTNGVSGMGVNEFQHGNFSSVGRVSAANLRGAGMVTGAMPVSPTRASLSYSAHQASYTPRSNSNQQFFTHQQPASVGRAPFAGGGSTQTAQANDRPAAAARSSQNGAAGSSAGWRRFGAPAGQGSSSGAGASSAYRGANTGASTGAARSSSGGWQRFGEPSNSGYRGGSSPGGYGSPAYGQRQPSIQTTRPSYSAPEHYGSSGNGGGYRGSGYSSQPHYSAPANSSSRSSGGGSSHSSGHSSGGGHSGGGGHHR